MPIARLICLLIVMLSGCSTEPSPTPSLIAFTATWCQPRQRDKPLLAEVAQEFPVSEINIDSQRDVTAEYGVTSVPTYVIVVEGIERQRTSNLRTALHLLRIYRQLHQLHQLRP